MAGRVLAAVGFLAAEADGGDAAVMAAVVAAPAGGADEAVE